MRGVGSAASLLVALATAACHQVIPIAPGGPLPPQTVEIELTDQGSVQLAQFIGPGIYKLRGDVVGATDAQLQLAMRVVTDRRDIDTFWAGELVTVPREYIARMQERKISKTRSYLTAGLILVGLFLLTDAVSGFAGLLGGGGRGGGVPQ